MIFLGFRMSDFDNQNRSGRRATASFFGDFIRSAFLSAATVSAVTPVSNYNNYLIQNLNKQVKLSFTIRRAFDGLAAYNVSVAPTIAMSLIINRVLCEKDRHNNQVITHVKQLKYATLSGLISAAFGNLPEAIAQAQQLSTPSPPFYRLIGDIFRMHGLSVVGRGFAATATKQVTYNIGFMWMMQCIIENAERCGSSKLTSLLMASVVTGLFVGIGTAPSNTLRWHQHHQINFSSHAPTYTSVLKKMFNSGSLRASLFAGWQSRAVMSTVSMLMLHEGKRVLSIG